VNRAGTLSRVADPVVLAAHAATGARAVTRAVSRLASIDILRGIIMVVMALDHVRDYFTDVRFDPLDPAQTTAALYATRWITNFCAPTFILLAGVSAYLVGKRSTPAQLSRFLLTRGLWLIALEWTVVTLAWTFNFKWEIGLSLQVIWAIGMSMVVLAALIHLPLRVVGAIGLTICVFHNLLDGVPKPESALWGTVWGILHVRGETAIAYVHYPLIPWIGVMASGYALGRVFDMEAARRRRILLAIGASAVMLFVALRLINTYGDLQPWVPQETLGQTVMAFLDVEKYPPSLMYLLATLGPALMLLAALESARGWFAGVLETFGRVPLFFYVLHIALAHLAAGLVAMYMGYGNAVLNNFFFNFPPTWGVSLPAVYLAWLLAIVTLYPACRWFAGVKRRRGEWWLSYL
jgi:uncharacterized membrane protein